MWYTFRIVLSWGIGIMGVLMILGAAGADCDGKCMDNALPLSEMLMSVSYTHLTLPTKRIV